MRKLLVIVLLVAGCSSDESPSNNASTADTGTNATSNNTSTSGDAGNSGVDAAPTPGATSVRVDDMTPMGQGLALDAVQNCNQVGMGCVGLVVTSSSDDQLDYAGVEDGPNSQNDTCSEATFTRLGASGSWVVLERGDGEAFDADSQINVWTGASACPLIEMGDKAFKVTIGDASEDCLGTCTVTVP